MSRGSKITFIFFLVFYIAASFAQKPGIVRIGVFTDCQYCDCNPNGIRQYRLSLAKLDSCIEIFNTLPLDGVFHLGDMIDHDYGSYDSILPRFHRFKAPLYLVLGNHDYMIKTKYKEGLIFHIGMMQDGRRIDGGWTQDGYRMDTGCPMGAYTTMKGKWCFIALNGDDLSFVAPQDKEQQEERNEMLSDLYMRLHFNGMPWNGGIGKKQMAWLEKQLEKAQKAGQNVIVLCHFPLFGKEDHVLFNSREVFALISRYPCVKAYFNGHYHSGGYKEREGIHLVNFKGMVDTGQNAFAIVTLTSDSIIIKGYGREPDRKLQIRH
jgi:3',5'-cyclic AMP phosphodiesterase CpdA